MYKLSDESIAQVAKLVQLAIITGTDVVDNLRMMRLCVEEDGDSLILTDEYRATAEEQILALLGELEQSAETPE